MVLHSHTQEHCVPISGILHQEFKLCGHNRAFLEVVWRLTANLNKWISETMQRAAEKKTRVMVFILGDKQWEKIYSVFLPATQTGLNQSCRLVTSSRWRQMWGSRGNLNPSVSSLTFHFVPFPYPFLVLCFSGLLLLFFAENCQVNKHSCPP